MKWIESTGGPLIIAPTRLLSQWHGINDPPSGGRNDYDEACGIKGYVGCLVRNNDPMIILGDEPLSTAWIPSERGGMVVRWVFGDFEAAVEEDIRTLSSFGVEIENENELSLGGNYIMFDSADPGDDILGEYIQLILPQGRYRISTHKACPRSEVELILHVFELISKASLA